MAYIDEIYGKQLEEALRGLVSRPALGQPWFGFHESEVPAGVLLFTANIHSRMLYADFWNYIQNKNLVKTEEEWQSIYSTQGWCPFYSDGDGIDTFRMPSAPLYLHGAGTLSEAGGYVEAGLPGHTHTRGTMNITGTLRSVDLGGNEASTGAFWDSNSSVSGSVTSGTSSGYDETISFDASRNWTGETSEPTNTLYGKSDTVTPETSKMLFGIWAISSPQKPIPDATAEGIINELGLVSNTALEAKNGLNGVVRSVDGILADDSGNVSTNTFNSSNQLVFPNGNTLWIA